MRIIHWQKIISFTKDLLFPIYCVACGKEGEWWCADCRQNQIHPKTEKFGGALSGVSSFLNYEKDGPVFHLIRQFKYNFASDMVALWREIIDFKKMAADWPNELTIIPVPLYRQRELERGYNQAGLIAGIIGEKLSAVGKHIDLKADILKRRRHTRQQALLNRTEREANVAGAFIWRGDRVPENILLVDDVYTTGATIGECALVLKNAGVKTISAVTLARGV